MFNILFAFPAVELRECTSLAELSLEHNRLVRPLLDFRSMARTLQTLRLFGNPLEFLPEILPCRRLRQVSLANVRIEGDAELTSVEVHVEEDAGATSYYFGGAKHRLSTFFQLIFRYSSCQVRAERAEQTDDCLDGLSDCFASSKLDTI